MVSHMRPRRGRPPKWPEGWRTTNLLIPRDHEPIWAKARELADREDITLSELVSKALAEYLNVHYPGNPQTPLQPSLKDLIDKYKAERLAARLEAMLHRPWSNREMWAQRLDQLVNQASRLKDPPEALKTLIQQALQALRQLSGGPA